MANNHFVYKDVEGALTQWDDIQRKLGNLPPKPLAFMPPSFKPAEDEDSKHKDKAHHRDCDYHRRLLLSCAPSTRKESVLMEANADMNMLKFFDHSPPLNWHGRVIPQPLEWMPTLH